MRKIIIFILSLVLALGLMPISSAMAYEENSIKEVYEIDSKIIGCPEVITFVDNTEDLDNLLIESKTPSIAILRINHGVELNVIDEDNNVLTPVINALNNILKNRIIPGFYVNDLDTAESLSTFIDKYNIQDSFVVSNDSMVLQKVIFYTDNGGQTKRRAVGGMLEIENSELSFIEMSELASFSGARSLLLNLDEYTYEEVKHLRENYALKNTTFYFKCDGELGTYKGIEYGVEGICTDDFIKTISILESFKENTLIRPIIIQAHRGMDAIYNENSLESIYASSLIGVNTIEIDPRLTKDNVIVLSHDEDVDRETGEVNTGKIKDYTISQLKAMDVVVNKNAPSSKFCTLEEVFSMYKEKEIKTKLALDAKETNVAYIDILYNLIEEYEMRDYIASIGVADKSQIEMYKEKFTYLSFDKVGTTTCGELGDEDSTKLNWLSVVYGSVNTLGDLDPYYTAMVSFPEINKFMRARAIKLSPYQFDTKELIKEAFYMDYANLSTGNSKILEGFLNYVCIDNINAKVNDDFIVNSDLELINGETESSYIDGFIVIDGEENIQINNNIIKCLKEGTAKVLGYKDFLKNGINYRVYSRITEININNQNERSSNIVLNEVPNLEPQDEEEGCKSSVNLFCILPFLGFFVFMYKKRKMS